MNQEYFIPCVDLNECYMYLKVAPFQRKKVLKFEQNLSKLNLGLGELQI